MSENITIEKAEATKNPKNPKRVSAGKKGAEAKKIKAELKRKEMEAMKKENIQLREQSERSSLKSITKDDHVGNITKDGVELKHVNIYKSYIPLCLIGVIGLGLYMYKSKQQQPTIQKSEASSTKFEKKEIDPFEFN